MAVTAVVLSSALSRSPIAADRAVDDDRTAAAADMHAATARPALKPTLIAADRAVEQHQRPAPALDPTTVAAFQAHRCDPIGEVAVNGAINNRHASI